MDDERITLARRKRSPWEVQRAVIFALVLRELRTRVGGRWLGMLWMLFEPLAHVLLMVTLFGFLGRTVSPYIEYPVFLVTGLVPFFIFRNLALRLSDSISANRGLFSYRQVKPIDTLVSRAVVELGLYGAVYVVTLGLLGWLGYHWLPYRPLEVMIVSGVLLVFGASLGLLFAVLTHERPKLRSLISLMFLPLYFASGVIFSIHILPLQFRQWLLWNPVLHLIELSRHNFIPAHQVLQGVNLAYPLSVTLVVAALSLSLYRLNRLNLLTSN